MKQTEIKTLMVQVALVGLVLGGATSVAGAHGNNPKNAGVDIPSSDRPRRNLDFDTPFEPPPDTQSSKRIGGNDYTLHLADTIDSYTQGVELTFGSFGNLPADFHLRTGLGQGEGEGRFFASHVTLETDGPIHGIPGGVNGLGVGPTVQVPAPPPGIVPSPGAIGLLGLAALTIRRRRRS